MNKLTKMDKVIRGKKLPNPTLYDVYKSEAIRQFLIEVLSDEFDERFEKLMKEGMIVKSLLIKPATTHKNGLKSLFVEYGCQMETLENLKIMLDKLNIWDEIDDPCQICQPKITEIPESQDK